MLLASGFIAASVIILGIRWFHPAAKPVHYHANFAVYINGQRDDFRDPTYYEELLTCSAQEKMTVKERTHMHDNVNDVVHVHDRLVTWEQFFNNLDYSMGENFLATRTAVYVKNDSAKVSYLLNGQPVASISNLVIGSEDRLLVSYGAETGADLTAQYKTIATSARHYNESHDPKSCSSGAPDPTGWRQRLKNLL